MSDNAHSHGGKPRGPHLELTQTQGLVMTPQLRHAISLLQMNNLELSAHLRQEIQANPFLDMNDPRSETDGPSEHLERHEKTESEDPTPADEPPVAEAQAEESWSNVGSGGSRSFDKPGYSVEQTLSDTPSLYDHLKEQVAVELPTAQDKIIAMSLMDGLDEAGYYKGEITKVAQDLQCDSEDVEAVIKRLQRFDPTGIFARDLTECLAVQLEERDRLSSAMQSLLDHLGLIEKHEYKKLCKVCEIDELTLRSLLAEIRTLNPRPGAGFSEVTPQSRIPDVLVRRTKDKNAEKMWLIELNPNTLPKVLINRKYYATIQENKLKKKEKKYMADRFNAANWLARALDQRAQSILKVATEIVKQQEAFFLYGVQYLKPLTLKDIAKEVDLHESTVSRVTTDKYIAVPRGIYELKFFFSSSLGSQAGGMEHSGQAVKSRIEEIIEAEDPADILSDDAIVGILEEEGISIARRTVAKYRKKLNIGSSTQRRREKKAEKFR